MRELGTLQDISHLDEEAFEEAAQLQPTLMASHSNTRHWVDGNRQLSDDLVRRIGELGGVVGLVALSKFLWPRPELERAPLSEVQRHAEHLAALIGWEHIGIGSDLDGGFGIEKAPQGLERYADWPRLGEGLPAEVLGANWLRFLTEKLPC